MIVAVHRKLAEIYCSTPLELEINNKLKQEAKELTKQKEEVRIAAKRLKDIPAGVARRKFDINIKLHEYIRTRHAKKPKPALQQSISPTPSAIPTALSHLLLFSTPTSPKVLSLSSPVPEIVRKRPESGPSIPSEIHSKSSSVETSSKPISWAEIASRPVAPNPSRLPIATLKTVCKPLENTRIACPLTETKPLSHCERPVPHFRWEDEPIWPAAAPSALVSSEGPWQMQPQKLMWPHTNAHFVTL